MPLSTSSNITLFIVCFLVSPGILLTDLLNIRVIILVAPGPLATCSKPNLSNILIIVPTPIVKPNLCAGLSSTPVCSILLCISKD